MVYLTHPVVISLAVFGGIFVCMILFGAYLTATGRITWHPDDEDDDE